VNHVLVWLLLSVIFAAFVATRLAENVAVEHLAMYRRRR
jgi:hypothetical protein